MKVFNDNYVESHLIFALNQCFEYIINKCKLEDEHRQIKVSIFQNQNQINQRQFTYDNQCSAAKARESLTDNAKQVRIADVVKQHDYNFNLLIKDVYKEDKGIF